MENKKEVPVQSVKKALDLFELLTLGDSTRSGKSLSELAKEMGMLPNSTHNILKTMIFCGFAAQNQEGKYIAGPKAMAIGQQNSLLSPETISGIEAELLSISEALEESVVFTSLINGHRVVISRVEAKQLIRVRPEEYNAINFFSTPTGRVLAAYADKASLNLVIENYGYPGKLWDGISTMGQLEKALEQIKKDAYAIIRQGENHIAACALPLLTANGKSLGAIGCHAPQFRCPDEKMSQILSILKESARRLANLL
ncbi:MAG: hypothetical protein A2X49_04630 [Lentisphaerae bacterium GWF2_52_8]|nr:MAG: hypothetical protein A2X49_04630 [Lentisphaerae bacterium GWF2_52_8]